MNVYVLVGEDYDAGVVLGVYSSLDAAKAAFARADEAEADYRVRDAESRTAAQATLAKAKADAAKASEAKLAAADAEIQDKIGAAEARIKTATDAAMAQIETVAADAARVARRGRELRSLSPARDLSLADLDRRARGAFLWQALRRFAARHAGPGIDPPEESPGEDRMDRADRPVEHRRRRGRSHDLRGRGPAPVGLRLAVAAGGDHDVEEFGERARVVPRVGAGR